MDCGVAKSYTKVVRQYYPLRSSLTIRVRYGGIVSLLPTPGTASFDSLCRDLKPFGLVASKYNLENPTSRLSDVKIVISLLQDQLTLRIDYEGFEIVIPSVFDSYDSTLLTIANATLGSLANPELNLAGGFVGLESQAHLHLVTEDPQEYLESHLSKIAPSLVLDAFAVNLLPSPHDKLSSGRIVIARSLLDDRAVYVDFTAQLPPPEARFDSEFVSEVRAGYTRRLERLGLSARSNEVTP